MSAAIIRDPKMLAPTKPTQEPKPTKVVPPKTEIEFAKCECCGLTEECTPEYIQKIRDRFAGKWICGLCSEAVKYEIIKQEKIISTEEAISRHMSFCSEFRSAGSSPPDPTPDFISVVGQILRRSLDSPRPVRSMPGSPINGGEAIRGRVLERSETCFSVV